MAKLSSEAFGEKMKLARAAKKAQTLAETQDVSAKETVVNTPEVKTPDLSKVLERLERLEKENEALKKSKENSFSKAKERLQWPRTFSYKIWWGVPVLSFDTFRKDPTKDLLFKNQFWAFESNHYLKVKLQNNETVEVEVNEFNRSHTKSDKLEARNQYGELIDLENLKLAKTFTFDTYDHGTFTVALGAIN